MGAVCSSKTLTSFTYKELVVNYNFCYSRCSRSFKLPYLTGLLKLPTAGRLTFTLLPTGWGLGLLGGVVAETTDDDIDRLSEVRRDMI